jgi:hypothetical protein
MDPQEHILREVLGAIDPIVRAIKATPDPCSGRPVPERVLISDRQRSTSSRSWTSSIRYRIDTRAGELFQNRRNNSRTAPV